MRKTCLVTGGAGFVGSHLAARLLTRGHHVICVDSLITGRRENVAPLMRFRRFRFVQHDVREPLNLGVRCDLIFHMASPASPRDYQKYPIETALTNALGTWRVLELTHEHHATLFLASTSEVYGDPEVHPQPETYWGHVNPVGPRSCYDEGKRFAEMLAMNYVRTYGCRIVIGRIFNTFGPRLRENDGRVVSTFLSQALRGLPITVQGDGSQTRSYCYVDDMVEAILKVTSSEKAYGEVVNLGNPKERSVLALAKMVKRLTRSSSPIVHTPLPTDDPRRRCPDIRKVRALVGWTPTTSLTKGLTKTMAWLKPQLQGRR